MTYLYLAAFITLVSIVTALLAVDLNPPSKETRHDQS